MLHQRGFIETWGTGFNKMVDEVRAAGLVVPLLAEVSHDLVVTFTKPGWAPDAFKVGLSKEETEILDALFARNGLSTAEAEELSGRPRRSLQRDLRSLADQGLIELAGRTHGARWIPILDGVGAKWRKGTHSTAP